MRTYAPNPGGSDPWKAEFGYTGHFFHAPSGTHLAWFRGYDPRIGRWLNVDPLGEDGGDNLYEYCFSSPFLFRDRRGRIPGLANAISGGASALAGWGIAKLTGNCYDWGDALVDFGTDAVGVGAFSKFRKLYRVAKLKRTAKTMKMDPKPAQRTVERFKNEFDNTEIEIKHVGNYKSPKGKLNPEDSWVPRARLKAKPGAPNGSTQKTYVDPFTGATGPYRSAAAHIPLVARPFTDAPRIGLGQGAANSLLRDSCE